MYTPWGKADQVRHIGRGIKSVCTPSHGGYYVPPAELAKMPEAARKTHAGPGWYEEDCDWCLVALAFPDLFEEPAIAAAVTTCENWMTAEQCAPFGLKMSARNVHKQREEEQRILDSGAVVRCAAIGTWKDKISTGRVHVLFRDKAGKTTGYFMKSETHDRIPLMQTATPEMYQAIEGCPLEPAPAEFVYEKASN